MCVPLLKKRKFLEISTLDDEDLDRNTQDDHSPQETHNDDAEDIIELHDNDVLSGRGSGVATHPGNVYFRENCIRYQEAYRESPRNAKMAIASEAALEIEKQNPPGRFLEKTVEGKYVLLSARKVLEKVSQALRDRMSPVSSPQGSCVLSPMSQGIVGSLLNNGNMLLPLGFVRQLAWLEEAQRLSSSYYEYLADAVSKDPTYAAASILAHDLPQGQPTFPENSLRESKLDFVHTSKDDIDRLCDAPEEDFNTSMAIFHYCVRNGYI